MRQTPSELCVFRKYRIYFDLEVCNNNWDYLDEQSFRLRTVILGRELQIIVGSPKYIPVIFEENDVSEFDQFNKNRRISMDS